jgi:hypothetical protein
MIPRDKVRMNVNTRDQVMRLFLKEPRKPYKIDFSYKSTFMDILRYFLQYRRNDIVFRK